jgi:outer membrane immunogenic protein
MENKKMKFQVTLVAAVAALAIATPAAANQARVEARAGMSFGENQSEEFLGGVAAGYDFDLGESAFIGAEASLDKVFVDNSGVVLGGTARLGMREGNSRFFVAGGYTDLTCDLCGDGFHAGAGVEAALSGNVYGKLEYRHFFFDGTDTNVIATGVGMRF